MTLRNIKFLAICRIGHHVTKTVYDLMTTPSAALALGLNWLARYSLELLDFNQVLHIYAEHIKVTQTAWKIAKVKPQASKYIREIAMPCSTTHMETT
jgi:hypothetical protein